MSGAGDRTKGGTCDMDYFDLTGRRALVTGGNRGLGLAIAQALAGAGAHVVLGVRDPASAELPLQRIRAEGGSASAVPLDVTRLDEARAALDAASDDGPLDILVNNAGGGINAPALDVTEADFDAVWSLTVRSALFLSQHVARSMPPGRSWRCPTEWLGSGSQSPGSC